MAKGSLPVAGIQQTASADKGASLAITERLVAQASAAAGSRPPWPTSTIS